MGKINPKLRVKIRLSMRMIHFLVKAVGSGGLKNHATKWSLHCKANRSCICVVKSLKVMSTFHCTARAFPRQITNTHQISHINCSFSLIYIFTTITVFVTSTLNTIKDDCMAGYYSNNLQEMDMCNNNYECVFSTYTCQSWDWFAIVTYSFLFRLDFCVSLRLRKE